MPTPLMNFHTPKVPRELQTQPCPVDGARLGSDARIMRAADGRWEWICLPCFNATRLAIDQIGRLHVATLLSLLGPMLVERSRPS